MVLKEFKRISINVRIYKILKEFSRILRDWKTHVMYFSGNLTEFNAI